MIFAARTTGKKFAQGDLTLTVDSGKPIKIHGIEFNNRSGAARVFTINNGAGVFIGELNLATVTHDEWSTPFLADKGLQIVCSGADGSVVIFHSNPGT